MLGCLEFFHIVLSEIFHLFLGNADHMGEENPGLQAVSNLLYEKAVIGDVMNDSHEILVNLLWIPLGIFLLEVPVHGGSEDRADLAQEMLSVLIWNFHALN